MKGIPGFGAGFGAVADAVVPFDPPPPRRTVRGRIVGPDGRPVAGAEYRLPHVAGRRSGFQGIAEWTRADADGSFVWTDGGLVPPDADGPGTRSPPKRFVARAPGFAPSVGPWIGPDDDFDVGTIALAPATRVAGRVIDEDGRAIEDVAVHLVPDFDVADEIWTDAQRCGVRFLRAGDDGTFEFDDLPAGRYRLHVALPDAAPATVVVSGTRDAVLVVPNAARPRQVRVDVLALGADGRPFSGDGNVRLIEDDGRATAEDLVDGRASIDVVTARRVHLVVRDRATGEECVVTAPATRDEPYVVQFGRAPTIRGRVVADAGARPMDVRGLRVAARPDDPDAAPVASVPVQDDGTFVAAVSAEGRYLLTTYGDGGDSLTHRWVATGDDVEIRLPAPASLERIDIVPRLPDGVVATACYVRAVDSAREFDVDAWGGAVVGLPAGRTWRVTVRALAGDAWFGPTTLDGVRSGGTPVVVALAPSPTIDGVVVRRDGSPVVGANVRAWSKAAALAVAATTGFDGRFRVVGLAPGDWRLAADTDALTTAETLVVSAGTRDLRVVLAPRRAPF